MDQMSEGPKAQANLLAALLCRTAGVREVGGWHERTLAGLDFTALERVKARVALTDAELARLLGIGEATLRRGRAAGAALDAYTSDRLYRLAKIIAVAEDVLEGPENAKTWLRRPQPALGGLLPLDLLVTHAGADEIEALLRRIGHGIYV
jgi:putative toxin-antitoxin system antitoxin component (TIGR02293 family)